MRRQKFRRLAATLTILCCITINSNYVLAAGGEVTFGSTEYNPEEDSKFPVGVYISTSDRNQNYHIELSYDSKRMSYIKGGDSEEDGVIVLEGNGLSGTRKYMLSFETLSGGNGYISVVDGYTSDSDGSNVQTLENLTSVNVFIEGEDTVGETEVEETTEETTKETSPETVVVSTQSSVEEKESDTSDMKSEKVFLSDIGLLFSSDPVIMGLLCLVVVNLIVLIVLAVLNSRKEKNTRREAEKNKAMRHNKFFNGDLEVKDLSDEDEESDIESVARSNAKAVAVEAKKAAEAKPEVEPEPVAELDVEEPAVEPELEPEEETVISVQNVTMKFKVATQSVNGIKDYFIQLLKRNISYREFYALDDVSFDVFKGEVVGIIGTNGSGKSTILKIVSGALRPTSGEVKVDRKKVQLLTLGTGFDMELTGRENVYLNGAIIGYSKQFLDEHYDEIVEFAELQDFMDEKVKNYSSGMVSRLGFAIATAGDAAEILILDEVLSVGDEFFRKKSLKRVKEMIHGGSTVLLVSHSMPTIKDNCSKVVWIEKGHLKMVGTPNVVCKAYQQMRESPAPEPAKVSEVS